MYDTVGEYGWRVDVKKHVIREVINTVLEDDREWEPGREVPNAVDEDEDCVVSFLFSSINPTKIVHGLTLGRTVTNGLLVTLRKTRIRKGLYINVLG